MITVLQIGLGPLGQQIGMYIAEKTNIRTIAAVDINKDLENTNFGSLINGNPSNVLIHNSVEKALQNLEEKPDVAILTTVSSITKLESQIEEIAQYGIPIVSTCEELSFPFEEHPESSRKIENICKKYEVACLGTGVNPGFLMDYLPSVLSSVCKNIDSVLVERIQDATPRRIPFQQKIGAGLDLKEFRAKEEEGTLRHVGLKESVNFLARSLNFELDSVTEDLSPVIAEADLTTPSMAIQKGSARGVQQVSHGYQNGKCKIKMLFKAAVGEPKSYDKITIKGVPSFTSEIDTGINGDIATCAITINAVKSILNAAPGLHTMATIGVPGYLS